jgi:hypothetical protein
MWFVAVITVPNYNILYPLQIKASKNKNMCSVDISVPLNESYMIRTGVDYNLSVENKQ